VACASYEFFKTDPGEKSDPNPIGELYLGWHLPEIVRHRVYCAKIALLQNRAWKDGNDK
jgi:hypothetical protein